MSKGERRSRTSARWYGSAHAAPCVALRAFRLVLMPFHGTSVRKAVLGAACSTAWGSAAGACRYTRWQDRRRGPRGDRRSRLYSSGRIARLVSCSRPLGGAANSAQRLLCSSHAVHALASLCGRVRDGVQIAVAASDSTGDRRAHAASSARQPPSVAWPDATSDRKALERAEVLYAEAAFALRASHASEIELQRQLDDVKAQLRRASGPAEPAARGRTMPSGPEPQLPEFPSDAS
jgi:hypothetical protein